MEINIQSQIGSCEEYMDRVNSEMMTVSIVIYPLKVISADDSNIRVTNGCNMWQACCNKRCHFSAAARRLPKLKGSL